MKTKVRFAPSPTGFMHLGNARMAVLNYFLAKNLNGEFILRIDDTDINRVKEEYVKAVFEDLTWLGISWNSTFKQSERLKIYSEFFEDLKNKNKIYPCYETKEELEYKKKLQLAKGKPPIYDRAALKLTQDDISKLEASGRKPHYRLKIDHTEIKWIDLIKGELSFNGSNLSDPVVIREDGSYLYILTSVLDDIQTEITHIIRGEDHVVNTALQIQMFQYLNAPIPKFAHLPLITSSTGSGFSKREGSLSLQDLRQQGIDPMAINNYLYSIGLSETNIIYNDITEISQNFDIQKYNKSSAKFDDNKLNKLNLYFISNYSFEIIFETVKEKLNISLNEKFWDIIKHNISNFQDIEKWYNVFYSNINTVPDNPEIIKIALNTIPNSEEWSSIIWSKWLSDIKTKTTLSGKNLFHPIRIALTGLTYGPEFKDIIDILGYEKTKERLENAIS